MRRAPAARIGRWSTRGDSRSRAVGRTGHPSGITAALHWQDAGNGRMDFSISIIIVIFGQLYMANFVLQVAGLRTNPV